MTELSSLDDLFKEAKVALRGKIAAATKAKEVVIDDPLAVWRNPANWIKGRGIALIHAETQTLLGNFTEYQHRIHPDARKLVRSADNSPVEATEYVNGDWWMLPAEVPQTKRIWKESKLITLPSVSFKTLGVSATSVCVYACFGEGSLDRVELSTETLFGGGSALMRLPKGVDILPELPRTTITAILLQLNQPL